MGGCTVSIGVGSWHVETLNATGFTEGVFSHMSVKAVCSQVVQALRRQGKFTVKLKKVSVP